MIIWDQAALADFVKQNQIGLTVNSLDDLESKIGSISEDQYNQMKRNVKDIAAKVRTGYFIKNAVLQAEKSLPEMNNINLK